ncbi:MAG: hypothetical protein WBV23_11175, partial [Desulfobaccales bacterium]
MMKKREVSACVWVLVVMALGVILVFPGKSWSEQDKWPRRFEHPKGTLVMYQPQLEDFKGDKLTTYAAISFQKKGWKQPVFGAVWLEGRVMTERDTRMSTIDDIKVTDLRFPNAKPEKLEEGKKFLNEEMKDWKVTISLDRLLAALAVVEKERAADQGLQNAPPKIIFTTHPVVLVMVDGDPKLLPIPDSKLMQMVNTPFFIFYDPAAKVYYLKGGDTWLSAANVVGPWKDVESLPQALKTLTAQLEGKKVVTNKDDREMPKKEVKKEGGEMPEIVVSTVPAELLVTEGEPQYTPIPDTNLLFVSNTENNIFMDMGSQEYYTLLSGRWFGSKSLKDGPWSYLASDKLPPDFAKIPPGSAKGFVLASVAGTQLAREAVLDNSIPQTAVIDKKKAAMEVKYVGNPTFEKIPGTTLEYATNTGTAVFQEGAKYYAVDQGVWYEADSPNGPWQVCASPPQEVNNLPASNPHYNAKYVKVYGSTDDTVTVGYTPGYTGSYVDNGTVVYGTGYDYPSYAAADAYIPYQSTYGYAATYDPYDASWDYQPSYYTPWDWLGPGLVGFGLGYVTGVATSGWWHGGWYGGGWWGSGGYYANNINIVHNNIYNRPWNPGNRWPSYQPGQRPGWGPGERPGWKPGEGPARPGRSGVGPGSPTTLPSRRPNLYTRPGNQNLLASRPGKSTTLPAQAVKLGVSRPRPAQATRPAGVPRPAQPKVLPAPGRNNVFADKQGNVHRRDSQGNWQTRQGNQWSKPQAPVRTATRPSQARQPGFDSTRMNREF